MAVCGLLGDTGRAGGGRGMSYTQHREGGGEEGSVLYREGGREEGSYLQGK